MVDGYRQLSIQLEESECSSFIMKHIMTHRSYKQQKTHSQISFSFNFHLVLDYSTQAYYSR